MTAVPAEEGGSDLYGRLAVIWLVRMEERAYDDVFGVGATEPAEASTADR